MFQFSVYKNIVRLPAWHVKFEKRKTLKKDSNEELILVAWHPRRWWNFCMPEHKKKEIETIFTEYSFYTI